MLVLQVWWINILSLNPTHLDCTCKCIVDFLCFLARVSLGGGWWLVLVGAMRWITIPAARYLLSPVGRRRIIFMLIWSIDVHVAWGAPLPLLYALHCSTLKCAKISAIWGWGKPHMRCLLSYLSLLSRIVFFSHALPSLFTHITYTGTG